MRNKVTAQTSLSDTTININEVTVISSRLTNFSAGTKVISIDSLSLSQHVNQNLSDVLSDESLFFVKSYGQGTLASASIRGGSANQTAVLWNGFNINSPMNGQMDLSLVPVTVSDNISVQYGGTSALWGSSAVSGVVHLSNSAKFNTGVTAKLNLSAGSFSDFNQQLSYSLSRKKSITSVKLFNTTAKNDFQYTNIYNTGDKKTTQSNAELRSYGLVAENYFLVSNNQTINLFAWCQHTGRNIPPTMLQLISKSNQLDNDYRFSSEWKYEKKKATTFVRAAYFNELLIYTDHAYDISDTSRSQSVIAEAETKVNLSKQHFINIGINNSYSVAVSQGYAGRPNQNRTAVFISYLFTSENGKLKINLSGREEWMQNSFTPFTFSAGTDYDISKWLSGKANISRVYRIPSFNDLYWTPGGNPDLLSESGYSEEAGLNLHLKNNSIGFTSDVTVFNRNIENWIIWLPGAGYWTPQNIMSVWSRGMETNSTLFIKMNKVKFSITVLSNYVVSTNEQSKSVNDVSTGMQLIYVPMYSGMAKLNIKYKNFVFTYRSNYTGYRYTSTDNTQYLKPYKLGSVNVSYKLKVKNNWANIFFQANNIWNEQYQIIMNRAMPAQNFNAGISFQFNKPNKS